MTRNAYFDEDRLDALFGRFAQETHLCVAVSGGPDSTALMCLLADWRNQRRAKEEFSPQIDVITVDHGLRPEASLEARAVGEAARKKGFAHHLLVWRGEKPRANIQATARAARYRLMAEQALALGSQMLLVAHTQDDQAETLLLRLARGSGVDGLCAMRPLSPLDGLFLDERSAVLIARPLLHVSKSDLLAYLTHRGEAFVEDPSNSDERYDRVRLRKWMSDFAELGGTAERLAATADHLQRASDALSRQCETLLAESCTLYHELGCVQLEVSSYVRAAEEIRLRLLRTLIAGVRPQAYPPRFEVVSALDWALLTAFQGKEALRRTACGVVIDQAPGICLFYAEAGRNGFPDVNLPLRDHLLWDGRLEMKLPAMRAERGRAEKEDQNAVRIRALSLGEHKEVYFEKVCSRWSELKSLTKDSLTAVLESLPVVDLGSRHLLMPNFLGADQRADLQIREGSDEFGISMIGFHKGAVPVVDPLQQR